MTEQSARARAGALPHPKNLWLASLGAMLEYYDFVVYIYVATKISAAFFPSTSSSQIKLAETLGIYSIGFLIRPLAGVLMSHYADRLGRKRLFIFTVALMSVSTLLIGFLPTYASVGWLAPALLLLLRIAQGCAVGGELPGAAVFVTEHAGPKRVGFSGGVLQSLAYGGFLLGAGAAVVSALIAQANPDWSSLSWRLPFIVGGALGIASTFLRRALEETPLFEDLKKRADLRAKAPVAEVARHHRAALMFGFGMVFAMTVTNVVYFQYWPTFLESQLGEPHAYALTVSLTAIVSIMIALPLWGLLADRFGWSRALSVGAVLLAVVSTWLFVTVPSLKHDPLALVWSIIPVAVASGAVVAPVPGLISALFPTAVRQSGYAVAYNIGVAIFGGPLPLFLVWLVGSHGLRAPLGVLLASYAVILILAFVVKRMTVHLGSPLQDVDPVRVADGAGLQAR